jgi:two-component system, NtrC family, sensor kinase
LFQSTPQGRYINVNDALVNILGFASAHEMLTSITDISKQIYVRSEDRDKILKLVDENGYARNFETELYCKDGSKIWVFISVRAIKDSEGRVKHYEGAVVNIAERKKGEESQRLAQMGKLVADMAHEVNNPLMIISGNAQLSLMEEIDNEAVKNNLAVIIKESQRAKEIIQRLLKFSRPSKGEFKKSDINKVVESVVNIVAHQNSLVNIQTRTTYNKNLPMVNIDENQIQEVLMNLLNNARDAMPAGGMIEITTGTDNDMVKIDVKDSGSGMTDEVMKQIFDLFFTTKEKGTGLGLSVCQSIMRVHRGQLLVASEAGKGTVFTMLLPVEM